MEDVKVEAPKPPTADEIAAFIRDKAMRASVVKVGTREIKVSDLRPFTMRDRVELKKLGLDHTKMQGDPEAEARFLHYALQRVDNTITLEEVMDVPYSRGLQVVLEYITKDREPDRPSSTSSTSSPGLMDGVQKT